MGAGLTEEQRMFRRGVGYSLCLHGLLIFALVLLGIRLWPEAPPPPKPVEMIFDAGTTVRSGAKGSRLAEVPRARAEKSLEQAPSPEPPRELPPEPPPPAPPPPPESASPPEPHKAPEPPGAKISTPGPPAPDGEIGRAAPPQEKPHQASPKAVEEKTVPKPLPPMPRSETAQPHKAPKIQKDSHSLLATLEDFRAEQKQVAPPRSRPRSSSGGDQRGGGSPKGDLRILKARGEKAIGASVRRCYEEDTEARNYASFTAHLIVTVDGNGVVRLAEFTPETAKKMQVDPGYRVLAERARRAVMSPVCSRLPLPPRLLGKVQQFRFVFKP